jgi:hypothetical protein
VIAGNYDVVNWTLTVQLIGHRMETGEIAVHVREETNPQGSHPFARATTC